MIRNEVSHTWMNSAFGVQHGSSGDCHARVTQLARMQTRMNGSKNLDSLVAIAHRRGSWSTVSRSSDDRPPYLRPLRPTKVGGTWSACTARSSCLTISVLELSVCQLVRRARLLVKRVFTAFLVTDTRAGIVAPPRPAAWAAPITPRAPRRRRDGAVHRVIHTRVSSQVRYR